MSLKIGIYMPTLSGGGAQRAALNLAEGLVGNDCKISLILTKAKGPLMDDIPSGVDVVSLNSHRTIASIPKLALHLRQVEYDVVISMMNYVNICAVVANSLAGNPSRLILVEQNTITRTFQNLDRGQRTVRRILTRLLYPQADYVTAVSEGVARDLEFVGNLQNVQTIPNPISINKVDESNNKEEFYHHWFSENRPVILGAGRLTDQKGFSTLVRSFRHVIDKEENVRLIIIGEGKRRDELERLVQRLGIKKYVSLPGFTDKPFEYMRNADLFVLSSRWEGFGNVLVEAMACGTPVVSTECPNGPAEILGGGKWGKLVPVEDDEAMAQAILDTLKAPSVRPEDLVQRAQDFVPSKVAEQYLDLIGPQL
jgi:glycosyltransferase involved in cell wall biosynthesis